MSLVQIFPSLIKLLVINLYFDGDYSALRRRLDQYSYSPSYNIGKRLLQLVYKGRNDHRYLPLHPDETVTIKGIDLKLLKGEFHRNILTS